MDAVYFASLEALLEKHAIAAEQRNVEFNEQLRKSRADFEEERRKSKEDSERRNAEFNELFRKSKEDSDSRHAKIEADLAAAAAQIKSQGEQFRKSKEDFDNRFAKIEAAQAVVTAQIKSQSEHIGGITKSQGLFAEEFFSNSVKEGKEVLFGQKFDIFAKNVQGLIQPAEYDIVLSNCSSLCIIEVKYRIRDADVPKVLQKVHSFRINYPQFDNRRIYLGVASLVFEKSIEDELLESGIAVIKQIGDSFVVNEKNMKVF